MHIVCTICSTLAKRWLDGYWVAQITPSNPTRFTNTNRWFQPLCRGGSAPRLACEMNTPDFYQNQNGQSRTWGYLGELGVPAIPARTCPFDPGYEPTMVAGHLLQSGHLMSMLKLSMACWLVAQERATVQKIAAAKAAGVPCVTGGGPFEIAAAQGALEPYFDLCAEMGVARVECGEGFTTLELAPRTIVNMARARCLDVQFELGRKHEGPFTSQTLALTLDDGKRWLDAGAQQLVIEARESARDVGLFDQQEKLNTAFAERLVATFGLAVVVFEAPNKASQFALLDHFGPEVHLSNVRLEELLRVEIYRRGLHADSFDKPLLKPHKPQTLAGLFSHAV
jgi:phosphosulfolactate synthase